MWDLLLQLQVRLLLLKRATRRSSSLSVKLRLAVVEAKTDRPRPNVAPQFKALV